MNHRIRPLFICPQPAEVGDVERHRGNREKLWPSMGQCLPRSLSRQYLNFASENDAFWCIIYFFSNGEARENFPFPPLDGLAEVHPPPTSDLSTQQCAILRPEPSAHCCSAVCSMPRYPHNSTCVHRCLKKWGHFYFFNNSVKRWPILIIFDMRHCEKKLGINDCSLAHLTSIPSLCKMQKS